MRITVEDKDTKRRTFLLEGNVLQGVLSVSMPMALFQLINEFFRVFDLAITSHINPDSVSAVSFFNQIYSTVTAVGVGLVIGAGILIAGYYGAGNYKKVK